MQFVLGILVLKTSFGFDAFQWLGNRVSEFLTHTDAGSIFVFGETYKDHNFAFAVSRIHEFRCIHIWCAKLKFPYLFEYCGKVATS